MWLWNFAHNSTPFHVYELLALVVGAVMAILWLNQKLKNRPASGGQSDDSERSDTAEAAEDETAGSSGSDPAEKPQTDAAAVSDEEEMI